MKIRRGIFILCAVVGVSICAILFSSPTLRLTSASSQTEVFIANVSSKSNESVVAEILIRNVEESGVCAATINLTYNSSVINAVSVNKSDFDSIAYNINNSFGFTKIVTYQTGAVGKDGDISPLNIEVITLTDNVGISIPHGVKNGSVIVESYAQFDTRAPENPFPSIFGIHNGTIKPNKEIVVSKLCTYSCTGTGGHSEYVIIWNESWNVTAEWEGYTGDWHNISFEENFTLQPSVEYNYTIHTGSYPQIHHTHTLPTANGWINCTEFIDANGKKYNDQIPAIRLGM
jgi:hypothetical protein